MRSPQHNQELDQNLVLLAHGALPLWPRLWMLIHLRRCAQCRDRITHLNAASGLLSLAIRGSDLPPWSLAQAVSRAAAPPLPRWLVALVLAALVSGLCVTAYRVLTPAPRPAASSAAGGCRPDLPNSRCR